MRSGRGRASVAALLSLACAVATARADVKTREFEYAQDGTALQGYIAWDDAVAGKRPGVLVVHEWWGHNEHARAQARRLAEAGYVGFALDVYGKGKVATHPKDAEAFMTEALKDPAAVPARFNAALQELKKDPRVDGDRIGAIGYCFGGAVVLNMARAGADLDAVATFHASLATQSPARPGQVKPRILVATGGADPMIPPEQVKAFEEEMKGAGARFEVISYPGVRHSFTNPGADKAGMEALAYDAEADRKSWEAAMKMFGEVFGRS